jgi:hypothetical protein
MAIIQTKLELMPKSQPSVSTISGAETEACIQSDAKQHRRRLPSKSTNESGSQLSDHSEISFVESEWDIDWDNYIEVDEDLFIHPERVNTMKFPKDT